MGKINFKSINDLTIDVIEFKNSSKLNVIGKWYYKFLKSQEEQLSLSIPSFNREFSFIAYNYVRHFSIIIKFSTKHLLKVSRVHVCSMYSKRKLVALTIKF